MSRRKNFFTLVIIPNRIGKVYRIIIPRFFLLACTIGFIIGIFALFHFITEYKNMKDKVAQVENLEAITRIQQKKIMSLANKVDEFKKTLENLRKIEARLRTLAGIGGNSTEIRENLGRGGPEKYILFDEPITKKVQADSLDVIEKIEDNVDFLKKFAEHQKRSLSQVEGVLEKRKKLFASTPNIFPVHGWISSGYGVRIDPFTGKKEMHKAIDIVAPWGTPVRASAQGKVVYAGWKNLYGLTIEIRNEYYSTRYGHLSRVLVKKGDWVEKGQIIGRVGSSGRSTGPHLHFEVWRKGKTVNPLKLMVEPLGSS